MNIKRILADNFYGAFFALCLTALSESAILRLYGASGALSVGICSFISIVVVLIVFLNRKSSTVYVGVAAVLTLILWVLNTVGIPVVEFIASSLTSFFTGKALETGELFCVCAILSLPLAAFLFLLSRLREIRIGAAALTVALLIYYGFTSKITDPVESFAIAGIIISIIVEISLCILYKKEKHNQIGAVVSFLVPLFIVFSLVTAVIPSSSEPIKWEAAKRVASTVVDICERIAAEISYLLSPNEAEFNIGMQGYSDADDVFGAGIESTPERQLSLSFAGRPCSSPYLIGNANDTYSGKGWNRSSATSFGADDFYLDYCETLIAFERSGYTKSEVFEITARSNLSIEYDGRMTKTLFYPLKTIQINSAEDYDASSSSIVLHGKSSKGMRYSLTYFEVDYASELFANAARSEFDYAEPYTGEHYLDTKLPDNINEMLAQRASYIIENYTALPECVTERTYALARELTADYTNDYDKLRVIEAYLRGYTYTTVPGDVPDGYDPIDYFLFESREGYCTYFASAMAVLARCAGIPSRYVQGYTTSIDGDADIKNIDVFSSNAHAWAEGYVEGIGWIPFEATASFAGSRYAFRTRAFVSLSDYDFSDYYSQDHHQEQAPMPQEIEPQKEETSFYIPIIVFTLIGTLVIAILLIAVRVSIFYRGYNKSDYTARFLICYRMIIYLLEKRKLARLPGETADAFASRVPAIGDNAEASFTEVNELFDRIRYGGTTAGGKELAKAEEYLRLMLGEIKKKKGRAAALIAFIRYCF